MINPILVLIFLDVTYSIIGLVRKKAVFAANPIRDMFRVSPTADFEIYEGKGAIVISLINLVLLIIPIFIVYIFHLYESGMIYWTFNILLGIAFGSYFYKFSLDHMKFIDFSWKRVIMGVIVVLFLMVGLFILNQALLPLQ